jgi:dienelactone hydrolase
MRGRGGGLHAAPGAALLLLAALALPGPPARAQSPAMTDDRWTAAATRFVRDLERGAYDDAARTVSPSVPAGAMSAERLRQLWMQLTGQLGPLAALGPGQVAEREGRHVVDLDARFARSALTVRVVLTPEAQVSGLWLNAPRPPDYAPPAYVDRAAFTEHDVVVGSGALALPGTLTLPGGDAPVPIVVLVHGSGPSDRDETLGANRPFRDLAWGLASRGVAVLRYDKRTYAHRGRLSPSVSLEEEVTDDALAALALARSQPRAAAGRVYLLGHSLGALVAPEVVETDGRVAGVALLAAPARPLTETVLGQLAYLRTLAVAGGAGGVGGVGGAGGAGELDALAAQVARLAARELPPDSVVLGAPARYFYDLDRRAPTLAARALGVPIFVAQGGRDYQVTTADFDLWRQALEGRAGATLRLYPDLNHLFMTGAGTATPEEYTARTGHVAREVVDDLAAWITTTTAPAHTR